MAVDNQLFWHIILTEWTQEDRDILSYWFTSIAD